jgi:hypothetical protein
MLKPSRWFAALILGFVIYIVFFSVPPGHPRAGAFDPSALGTLELAVFQAEHERHTVKLFVNIVAKLREEQRYTWFRAVDAGFHRTRAILSSQSGRVHYDIVLPDLERAYEIERDWRGASFDAKAAARAELDSWMARRRHEVNTQDYVSSLIAESDAIRYNASHDLMRGAALARLRALELRDGGGTAPDWNAIRVALTDSYRIVHQVLRPRR